MCGGSKSSTTDTTQSLQLGSPSFGGADYVLNFPNVTTLPGSISLPAIAPSGTSTGTLTSSTALTYGALGVGAFLLWRLLK